jgi:hypothetical protein
MYPNIPNHMLSQHMVYCIVNCILILLPR